MKKHNVRKLAVEEMHDELENLNRDLDSVWKIENQKLVKEFNFNTFKDAFSFMNDCIPSIEEAGHHPEWFNVYNKVLISLVTHDAGGISCKDIQMARKMDSLFQEGYKK